MTLERLNDELKRIDRRLSCSFNGLKSRYQVSWHGSKKDKDIIYEVPLGQLGLYANQIIEGLKKGKQFSAKEKNRMLDEQEDREERKRDKQIEDDMEYATAESYDIFQRLEGLRVTLPGGFEVRDKRRVSPEQVSL